MPWIVKDDKPDFVGKWALPHANVRERLVGFTAETLPPEGAQVVRDGRIAGRVTSSRHSERVGTVIGLCWVQPDQAEEGTRIAIRWDGAASGDRHAVAVLRPEGNAAAIVSRLAFLSPDEADIPRVSPIAHVPAKSFMDVSHLGKLEVRGGVPAQAIPIGPNRGLVVIDGDVRAERDRLIERGLPRLRPVGRPCRARGRG